MDNTFNAHQATDLVRHFLGDGWYAQQLSGEPGACLLFGPSAVYTNISWRRVFRDAGIKLPSRRLYIAKGTLVMLADKRICEAWSTNLAQRIAEALNALERGS